MKKFLAAATLSALFALPAVSVANDYDHDGDGRQGRDCRHDNGASARYYNGYQYNGYQPRVPPRYRAMPVVYRPPAVYRAAPVIYRPAPVIYRQAPQVVYRSVPVYQPAPVYPAGYPVYRQANHHHDNDSDDALWAVGGFVLGAIVGHEVGNNLGSN